MLSAIYGWVWNAATPLLRRHKRLADGFSQRLVPPGWPGWPVGLAPRSACGTPELVSAAPSGAGVAPGAGRSPATEAATVSAPLRIWIQAASGGEAWLVHSLVPALSKALRETPELAGRPLHLLCTTCTRQGLEVLEKLTSPATPAEPPPASGPGSGSGVGSGLSRAEQLLILPRYFPLDHPRRMERALRQADVQLILLLETELWPGLLEAARQRNTPVLVLNGRMRESSLRAYRLLAPFLRRNAPREVLAIAQADAARFSALFGPATRVSVMQNIKFDRIAQELRAAEQRSATAPSADGAAVRVAAGLPVAARLIALASVREEEEPLLLPALLALQGRRVEGASLALAVAPRHMHRIAAWRELLAAAGLPVVLRSAAQGAAGSAGPACAEPPCAAHSPGDPPPVLLWDTFGELRTLYAAADAVFVGGSLAPLGGQNFLEPLALGLTPVVGPHLDNFAWIGGELPQLGLVRKVAEPAALAPALLDCLALALPAPLPEAARRRQVRERFAAWLDKRCGGSAQAARSVLAVLLALPHRSA